MEDFAERAAAGHPKTQCLTNMKPQVKSKVADAANVDSLRQVHRL